jgi:transposase
MNYVGIDISKYKHDCFIITDLGEVINEGFSFTNNAEGFAMLLGELKLCNADNTRIGFEATGHYGVNLKLFLEKNGYSFMEINPVFVKEYIKSQSLRRTHTDKLDPKHIAGYLMEKVYRTHQTSFYNLFSLKQLTRLRADLVGQRSHTLVQLTNVMDCVFPEFKPFFSKKFSATALYILAHYPSPEKIANMNVKSFDILRRKSHGKFSMDKFVKLKALAKNTVGMYTDFYGIQIDTLLDVFSQLDCKVDALDKEIIAIITQMNPPTLSIKGIGAVSAAVIVSETGDFSRFSNSGKLLSFAGLEPGYFQSGQSEYNGHMVKHGSAHLRCAIMNCARAIRLHNEVFAAYYYKKIAEGKDHEVALSHVAKKLVRLIYTLETKGILFDPAKLR